MRFFSTAIALAAIPAAVLGATFNVTVGANSTLAFNPTNISAAVGDTVNFVFQMKNHSVTQSTFTSPCTKAMFNGSPGVNSGFLPLSPNASFPNGNNPTWSITISNSTPLWFYCAQKIPVSHCQKGMVFSINATPQKSFDMFLATAMASGSNSTAAAGTSAPTTASQAASNQSPNGASKLMSTRGAAGLLTIVTIGAMLF